MTWPAAYACATDLTATDGRYALRPIRWEDRQPIRRWRNDQIDVLRQDRHLSEADQDDYFSDVVRPQLESPRPAQVLFGLTAGDDLVGYGGVVHISWSDQRGEVSFLTASDRQADELLRRDWTAYLRLLVPLCRDRLGLHKLTTETYEFRRNLIPVLEDEGFLLEGTLREHHRQGDVWITSLAHGLILNP